MTPENEVQDQPRPPRVSVVIVSLNRRENLRELLQSLGEEHQVIVVDNGSNDGAQHLDTEFPHVRFSKLPKNFGLTKALNIGVRAGDGEYVLLLHDDVVITGESVTRLADVLENRPDVAAVCPLLTDEQGRAAAQCGPLITPQNKQAAWTAPSASGDDVTVECTNGAALMFRTSFLKALRYVDERYGTFGSALELGMQVRRASRKLLIVSGIGAIHRSLNSSVKRAVLDGDRIAGTAAYLAKHHGFMPSLTYRLASGVGALLTVRIKSVAGAFGGVKIDGTS